MNNRLLLFFLLLLLPAVSMAKSDKANISGELKKWHKITITFEGPETAEKAETNPFLHYRLNVTFIHTESGKSYTKPGYFAADGDAANSSSTSGNKWNVHFAPDEKGKWLYEVSFREGPWVAVSEEESPANSGGYMDGATGSFTVASSDKKGRDFRARGRLEYVGKHYLEFADSNELFLKVGPDAPENFLAYEGFDGTFHDDGHRDDLVKDWQPHVKDWQKGDPTWQDGKGKGIIGALNYLASKGMNSISFLTFNIQGDDRNVFPFIDYTTYNRYDVSKLAQWEKVFSHADSLGIFLHFKTQETENQGLLDNGGLGVNRKLYYRELIARFGHHLALNWNLGEENGEWEHEHITPPQHSPQRRAMAKYFHDHDPYDRHIVIHNGAPFDDMLGDKSKLTGPSIQTHREDFRTVHKEVLHWREKSIEYGQPWSVAVDEPGTASRGIVPDQDDPDHNLARKNALWGAFMAGAWGVEWYFGYDYAHSDLNAENFRSRDNFWDQCRYLLQFFKENQVPLRLMEPDDALTDKEDDYVMARKGEVYVFYQKSGSSFSVDLKNFSGSYQVDWYNPRTGKYVFDEIIKGGQNHTIEFPDLKKEEDWTILVKRNR